MFYRVVEELSSMSNNDERVYYTTTAPEKEYLNYTNGVVVHRPVLDDEKVNVEYKGPAWIEPLHDKQLTRALDDFYKLKNDLTIKTDKFSLDIGAAITMCIMNKYYSCMSAGCGIWYLSAIRYFIEHYNIDRTTELYPGDEEMITINDFLEDIKDVPDLRSDLQITQQLLLTA